MRRRPARLPVRSRTGRCAMRVLVTESGRRLRVHGRLERRNVRRGWVLQELEQVGPHMRLPTALEVVEAEDEAARADQRLCIGLGHGIRVRARLDLVVWACEAAEVRPDCAAL